MPIAAIPPRAAAALPPTVPSGGPVELADRLVANHRADPAGTAAAARSLLRRRSCPPEARAVAGRALALARYEAGELGPALGIARRALAVAAAHGLDRRAGQVRLTLAHLEAERGRLQQALVLVDEAQPVLRGPDAARARCLRGILLARSGQLPQAVAALRSALPAVRRHGDQRWEALALSARGLALAYLGQLRAADADLAAAEGLFRALGEDFRAACQLHNRGFVALRGGDIPCALELFDRAAEQGSFEERFPELGVDRADALMSVGLLADARELLDRCLAALDHTLRRTTLAEALLVYSYCAMRQRDIAAASAAAIRAERLFRSQRRTAWVPLARYVVVRTRWVSGERSPALRRDAQATAERLDRHGWALPAQGLRLIAARVALDLGERQRATQLLGTLARARHRGPADLRAPAWYAEALRRNAAGDRRGTLAALDAGMRVVDEHAAAFSATELQAHAAALARDLASLAVRISMGHGSPGDVLRWTERYRAGALTRPSVRPPNDPAVADALVRLRAVAAETKSPSPPALLRQQRATLEAEVRRLTLHGAGTRSRRATATVAELSRLLGQTALVSYLRLDDELFALSLVAGRLRQHRLGSYAEACAESEVLRACLHRLARLATPAAPATAAAAYTAARVQTLLIEPLLTRIGDRPLVVAPTGDLHALPWSVLPLAADRPLTVAPSATAWRDAVRHDVARPGQRSVFVAGPGLLHAETEVADLSARVSAATVLGPEQATAEAALRALDGAELAHVAAHGHFRSDNPQFSSLDLTDGPLYVYDLERMRRGPRRLVLSACDTGLSGVHPGDELVGITTAVLRQGSSTLIASLVPVSDDGVVAVMGELHARLNAGARPATALLQAQRAHGMLGFGCFGAG